MSDFVLFESKAREGYLMGYRNATTDVGFFGYPLQVGLKSTYPGYARGYRDAAEKRPNIVTAELARLEQELAQIVASVHGVVPLALANKRDALLKDISVYG